MTVDYKRESICEGLTVCDIYDKKFKTFGTIIRMILPLDKEKILLYSLALDIISTTNRKYPEREQLSLALTDLYNAAITSNCSKVGDSYFMSLTLNCLCDEYTLNNEQIADKAVSLLLDCLLDPYIENGAFSEKYFELCRSDALDDIAAMINNKRRYSILRANKYIYENELAAVSPADCAEFLKKATARDVYEQYREILRTAVFDISFTGGYVSENVKNRVIDAVRSLEREPVKIDSFRSPSPLKPEIRFAEENVEANQAQLIMAYKTNDYNEYASKLFINMLGALPTSKLFMNVREKMSLCYYCDASPNELKSSFIVSSGLDPANLELARKAIEDQVKAMQSGDFSDEEIENAKVYLSEAYLSNYDSKYDINQWYMYQFIRGTNDSPEEKGRKIMAVTREDIIREAKGYILDTVFVMMPGNGGENDEA